MDFHGVKVREFVPPEGVTSAASIVYIHGGAWVAGSIGRSIPVGETGVISCSSYH